MKYVLQLGLAGVALLFYMFRNANNIKEKRHLVKLKTSKSFKPFRLVFIADIHRKKLPENFFDFSADMIVIAGDLTEGGVPLNRTAQNLRILTEIAPVYFVWGNNDREVGERNLRKLLNHYQIRIMDNTSVELLGHSHLKLVGIDYFNKRKGMLKKAFADIREDDAVIFVSHTPAVFNAVRNSKNTAFLLAGHTHGGQIRIGKLGLYKKGAFKKVGSRYELVTNGYGTTSLPLRLGAEAQYHVIDILPEMSDNK